MSWWCHRAHHLQIFIKIDSCSVPGILIPFKHAWTAGNLKYRRHKSYYIQSSWAQSETKKKKTSEIAKNDLRFKSSSRTYRGSATTTWIVLISTKKTWRLELACNRIWNQSVIELKSKLSTSGIELLRQNTKHYSLNWV